MTVDNPDLMYRLLVQGVSDYAIYMLDPDGHVINWNAGAERAKGYLAAEIIGKHFATFYSDEDRAIGLPQRALSIARQDQRFESEGWRLRKNGSRFWTSVVIEAIRDERGVLLGFAKITRDVSEQRQQQLNLIEAKELAEQYSQQMAGMSRFLDSVIANIPASVLVLDAASRKILLANQQAQRLFAPRGHTLVGRMPADCLNRDVASYIDRQTTGDLSEAEKVDSESLVQTVIGPRNLRSRTAIGSRPDEGGDYVLLITEDVTEELAAYAQIHHMAQHDGLTDLPNRVFFNERLAHTLEEGLAADSSTAVLCLDLDNFKIINDTLGHAFGDKILLALGKRLKKSLREQDTLARLGGDEFAVVLPRIKRLDEARFAAQRLIDAVEPAFLIDGHSFSVGLSVGVAITSAGAAATAEELMRHGDMALYEAKRNGRNRYELFRPELEQAALHRHQMEIELRRALHQGQLQMHYQPVIESDGRISGYEALMRWQHPSRGLVAPMEFIPIAEETGMIHEIGVRALHLACQEAATWDSGAVVAVNLSPVQFKSGDLVSTVALALADSGLPPQRLELEITESVLLDNTEGNIRTLRGLKQLGVAISLDDFGTGYSSLSYLRSFPFDRIKIDRSFVRDMGKSKEAMAIIRAITGLSSSLLIKTTAEGVETEEQFLQLKNEGCSHFQGFLFGRPEAAENMLQQTTPYPATL